MTQKRVKSDSKKGFRSQKPFFVSQLGVDPPESLLSHFNCFGLLGALGGATDHNPKVQFGEIFVFFGIFGDIFAGPQKDSF